MRTCLPSSRPIVPLGLLAVAFVLSDIVASTAFAASPVIVDSQSSASTQASKTFEISKSQITNLAPGDLIVIQVVDDGSEQMSNLSGSGWFIPIVRLSPGLTQQVIMKAATVEDLNTTSYTATYRRRTIAVATFFVIRGASFPSGFQYRSTNGKGTSKSPTTPAIFSCAPDMLMLNMVAVKRVNDVTPPVGFDETADAMATPSSPNIVRAEVSSKPQPLPGVSETYTASIPSAQPWIATTMAITSIPCPPGGPWPTN